MAAQRLQPGDVEQLSVMLQRLLRVIEDGKILPRQLGPDADDKPLSAMTPDAATSMHGSAKHVVPEGTAGCTDTERVGKKPHPNS